MTSGSPLRFFALGLAGAALAAPSALAQAPDQSGPDQSAPEVSEVVVTTRLPTLLSEAPDAYVVDRAQIEARNALFAADVLGTVPGVALSRNGAFGGVTSLRIRGASSDKTLVLIDGAPVNDPSQPQGGFDVSSLDLADVQRIEILEGPQGSLWGSDAIGGVVNIITRDPNGFGGSAEAGSYWTRRFTAEAGTSTDAYALGMDGSFYRTDGISKADRRFGNTEADAFKNVTFGANARVDPTDWLKLDARIRYNKADTEYDSSTFGPPGVVDGPDISHVTTWSGLTRATVKDPWGFTQTFMVDASTIDRIYGGPYPFGAKGGRLDFRWTAERNGPGPNAFALGAEREQTREDTGGTGVKTGSTAVFGIWRFTPAGPLSTTVSVRRDEPDRFQGRTTARAEARLKLGVGFSASASYGQGFKVPSLFETTYPCSECVPPGPARNLKPERADGWDGTLSWAAPHGRAEASVTLYQLNVRDQIDYIYPQGYLNIARTRSTGLEAHGRVSLGAGFGLDAEYAYTDAKDLSTGAQMLRVPRNAGSIELDWSRGKAQLDMLVRAQSSAPDVYGAIAPFAVVEGGGSYALTEKVKLTLRVENLLNSHYEQAYGYGEPGVSAYVGVSLRY